MFLRANRRKKNGKLHRYWSIVESRRLAHGNPAQRQVLYLGEINDSQEAAWRKTIEVFDEERSESREVSLFPSDRSIPPDEADGLSVKLSEMRLVRPRSFGDCWLGCLLWEELGLSQFWQKQLNDSRGVVPWEKVLQLLAVNRLIEPGSELAVHRSWFLRSAMAPGPEVEDAVRCFVRRAPIRSDQSSTLSSDRRAPTSREAASRSPRPSTATVETAGPIAGKW